MAGWGRDEQGCREGGSRVLRRLAGAQEDRHRLAALDMVDVHRQKAAGVVMRVEQRQLSMAVHRVAGLVDVERDRRRRAREGAAEDVDQGGRQAGHLAARRRVLKPAHGQLRTEIPVALRRPADGQLEQRIVAQGVGVVCVLPRVRHRRPGDRLPRRRSRTCGPAESPAACGPPGRGRATPGCSRPAPPQGRAGISPRAAGPARRWTRSNHPRNRRSPSCVERLEDRTGEGHLRSWQCGAFVASVERRWETNFYPIPTTYATFATTSSPRAE